MNLPHARVAGIDAIEDGRHKKSVLDSQSRLRWGRRRQRARDWEMTIQSENDVGWEGQVRRYKRRLVSRCPVKGRCQRRSLQMLWNEIVEFRCEVRLRGLHG